MEQILLTPTEIGDALDLEEEGIYPCSDGSIHHTLKVDNLLQAQLKKVVEFIDWLDNGTRSSASWRAEVRKFKEALLKEAED